MFELPTPVPRKLIRNATITILENRQKNTQVEIYDNRNRGNYNLSDENIQGDEAQAIRALLFPFGMIQTSTQIMLNWPDRFRNNRDDSLRCSLSNFLKFKRGYKINKQDILENLDAVLIEDQSWYQVNYNR